jgi:hypothetical protein
MLRFQIELINKRLLKLTINSLNRPLRVNLIINILSLTKHHKTALVTQVLKHKPNSPSILNNLKIILDNLLLILTSDHQIHKSSKTDQLPTLLLLKIQLKELKMMILFKEENKIKKEDKTTITMVIYLVIKKYKIYNFFNI